MKLPTLLHALEQHGLLLLQDAKLPNVVSLVSGGPVQGSWWSARSAHAIYALLTELDDHPDVASAKLVSRKVTLVHRRLFPELAAIGRERARWQLEGLSREARALLERVDEEGEVRATGKACKELTERLLAHSGQVHTDSGAHATVLTDWKRWARARGPLGRLPSAQRARTKLEETVARLNEEHGGRGTLPWASPHPPNA